MTTATNVRKKPAAWQRLLRNPSGFIGLIIIAVFVVVALLAAFGISPYPPAEQHVRDRLTGPSSSYLLGTDLFGRDLASRLMEGARNSLYVALLSVLLASVLGISLGLVAGYLGHWADNLIMRIMDVFFAFPALLLALLVITVLGAGLNNTVLAIGIVYTPIFARVARGPVLAVKEMEFVQAGRSLGANPLRLILKHILPNILAPLLVQISLALSWSLLTEAGLSFLGLGVQPPAASWGVMLSESRGIAERAPWLMFFPGAAIALGVLGFNLLGDGLRDVLDPKARGR
ncbi:MAG: ABC transporter permease [Trueperaceae bacterium]|nr:ABC transporter permease [Trueperaceae bacterium]